MRAIAIALIASLAWGCVSREVEEGPLREYLTGGRERSPEPPPVAAAQPEVPPAPANDREPVEVPAIQVPPPDMPAPVPIDENALRAEEEPFFVAYLGEHRYDVVKNVLIPIKGGEVVYRFRKVDNDKAYPPFAYYLEFEFQVKAEGPGLLFIDEARFVSHAVYDGRELHPRLLRVGLRDGSFRYFRTYEVDESRRRMKITDEITGLATHHLLEHQDTMDPITFFFNLFCLGIDLTKVESLHGHLLHEDESAIVVEIDQEERTAEVAFREGEFLPRKPSRFRFFFDEKGRVDVSHFELEYGAWSMSMNRTGGEIPPRE